MYKIKFKHTYTYTAQHTDEEEIQWHPCPAYRNLWRSLTLCVLCEHVVLHVNLPGEGFLVWVSSYVNFDSILHPALLLQQRG